MAESIFIRIRRIVAAGYEEVVDRMERSGGASVMRESIRDIERIIDEARTERDHATARRLQAVRQQGLYRERVSMLQQKAEFAMDQAREDLAEAALTRQLEFEQQMEALAKAELDAAVDEKRLEEALASLSLRKAQMEEDLKAFEAARQDLGLGKAPGKASRLDQEKQAERAEAAFQRAMQGAGGIFAGTSAQTAARLGEIDQLITSSAIAERLEALRQRRKAS